MAQRLLPILPAGSTGITDTLSVLNEGGRPNRVLCPAGT